MEWIKELQSGNEVIELSPPYMGDDDEMQHDQEDSFDNVQPSDQETQPEDQENENEQGDNVPEPFEQPSFNYTLNDPFLSKLSSDRVILNDVANEPIIDDDDTRSIDDDFYEEGSDFRIKKNEVYPRHDPTQQWDLMQPILGTRFESPQDLKFCLANYAVANGYQLGYQRCESKCILCLCGESARRRRAKKGEVIAGEPVKNYPFRLWASWMTKERSFQIKSLNPNHTCSRKYNLGSLVTYEWIARHYFPDIIENPHITIRGLQEDVLKRFNIQVSRNHCRNAKIKALYDLEGGLKEHYGRLWDYAAEIRRSNPWSTAKLSVNTMPDGSTYFSGFYVCYKAVRDGWINGCRRVVGIDGCFLRGPVQGELLSAMGRDANNHIYPIAWAVVCVENRENWEWFLKYLMEDLGTPEGMWRKVGGIPPLPPKGRKMPGRPKKKRIRHPSEQPLEKRY